MEKLEEILFKDPEKTLIELLKVNNREIPFANLLAFYFRPKEKHNLKGLFLDALLETQFSEIGIAEENEDRYFKKLNYDIDQVNVFVEKKTGKNNRIDILIESDAFVFCIEFKIDHDLDNPLEDYVEFINTETKYKNKQKYFVILTPYSKEPVKNARAYFENNNVFKQVILRHFIRAVREKVVENGIKFDESVKYFQYYKDFVQTVENREIRSKRYFVLNQINNRLKASFKSQYHSNNNGGFVEILKAGEVFKIRFRDSDLQLEKWVNKKKISQKKLNRKVDIEKIINLINELKVSI